MLQSDRLWLCSLFVFCCAGNSSEFIIIIIIILDIMVMSSNCRENRLIKTKTKTNVLLLSESLFRAPYEK